jgi:stearoyl-CoA desaturase (Delta-9 desaturase)
VTRPTRRIDNGLGGLLDLVGLICAIALVWRGEITSTAIAITAAMYVLTGLGISVGFHRLLTHRAFETTSPVRATFAICGSMAAQGPVIAWVAEHRKHHAFADEEGDPHSPHLTKLGGLPGAIAGLWHAHAGWFFCGFGRAPAQRYAPDLLADPTVRFIDRTFALWVTAGLALPFAAGYALSGTASGALTALLWGGFVRIFLLHHMTFAINSLCHFFGRVRFATSDGSRNLSALALLSFGESWHNNHHAFPTSAFHGMRRREIDLGGLLIRALERFGLAWNVNRVSLERQASKLLERNARPVRDGARI